MNRRVTHRRGSIFLLALTLTFVMVSLVLVLSRQVRVEAIASANQAGTLQAAAIERGAEAYCIELLDQQAAGQWQSVVQLDESYFYQVPIGPDPQKPLGYFWVVRPYCDNGQGLPDPSLPLFGIVDEASKINVNLAPLEMLQLLPGLDQYPEIADAIVDWRDSDDTLTDQGAEDSWYLMLPTPYHCKNAPFEALEELLLVRGVTPELLYGMPGNPPLGTSGQSGSSNVGFGMDPQLPHGLYDLLTVYGAAAATTGTGGSTSGGNNGGGAAAANLPKVNPLTASRSVLMCLPGVTAQLADQIITARQGNVGFQGNLDITTTDWAVTALGAAGQTAAQYLTATSSQYSADIVAVTADGRSFRHVRVVIDTATTPPHVVFRKDVTDQGWPLDPQILDDLRARPGHVATGMGTNRPGM